MSLTLPTPHAPTANAPETVADLPQVLRSTTPTQTGSPSLARPAREDATPRRAPIVIGLALASIVVLGGMTYFIIHRNRTITRPDYLLYHVKPEALQLTVVERGALESADNREVVCRVRAGTKASQLVIKWVIDDGTQVKANQLLVELDDSALQDQLKVQKIALDKARSDMLQAEQNLQILKTQNTSDLLAAENAASLAVIDLQKYKEGDYLQSLKDIRNRTLLAEADLEQQKDRSAWMDRMVKMGYQSPSQAQAETSRLKSLEVALEKVKEELRVLERYTKDRTEQDLNSKIRESELSLKRVNLQAEAKLRQAETDYSTKKSVFDQEEDKYEDIEEQIRRCRIYSPQDGMVVYYVSDQSRFGSGSSQSIIAQGEPVREGQKLMRIPDLRRMVVNTKVHEAMVSRVHGEVYRQTGFVDTLRAVNLIGLDGLTRWTAANAMSEAKELFRDKEQEKVMDGQRATVRIDAFPDRVLPGHIKSVATVAAQQDWMSADVKVYQTMVSIDESLEGLKPGMSAEVTMHVESTLENVLTVPLQAIFGGSEMGKIRKLFVMTPDGPKEREITLGLSNEKLAEVKSGLVDGDEVVLNPKVILGDKVKTRSPVEDRPGVTGDGKGGKGKGGKGKGGAPSGGGMVPGK